LSASLISFTFAESEVSLFSVMNVCKSVSTSYFFLAASVASVVDSVSTSPFVVFVENFVLTSLSKSSNLILSFLIKPCLFTFYDNAWTAFPNVTPYSC
jgi:hypothetical protein